MNLSPKCFNQISSGSTRWMQNLIPHPNITHVSYFWWTLLHEKWEIHEKRDCNHVFSCIFHFSHSRVHQKYATWVLLGWRIKFCIQWVIPLEKVVLLFYYFLIFLPFYSKNGQSSPMVEIIILNIIGSYKVYFGCTFFLGGPF